MAYRKQNSSQSRLQCGKGCVGQDLLGVIWKAPLQVMWHIFMTSHEKFWVPTDWFVSLSFSNKITEISRGVHSIIIKKIQAQIFHQLLYGVTNQTLKQKGWLIKIDIPLHLTLYSSNLSSILKLRRICNIYYYSINTQTMCKK